jgi:DNA-directed RNA polymerase specialized sigma24 family protein
MEQKQQDKNIFTSTDHLLVRNAVCKLPGLLAHITALRFWQNYSIIEIAVEIGVSVKIVEDSLKRAFRILREECLRNPVFSRSLYLEIQRSKLNLAA